MSLMTRKNPADGMVGVRDRAVSTAQRAVPAAKNAIPKAKQVVPMAKDAGLTVRSTAEDAAAWAKPYVDDAAAWARPKVEDARSWAAPRLERSGVAVQETIAPAISEAMVSAARRLDVRPARKRRRWAGVLAVTMLLAAAASAAAAAAMRRRPADFSYAPDETGPADVTTPDMPAQHPAEADGSQPDAEAKGDSGQS